MVFKVVEKQEIIIPVHALGGKPKQWSTMQSMGELECNIIIVQDEEAKVVKAYIGSGDEEWVKRHGLILPENVAIAWYPLLKALLMDHTYIGPDE